MRRHRGPGGTEAVEAGARVVDNEREDATAVVGGSAPPATHDPRTPTEAGGPDTSLDVPAAGVPDESPGIADSPEPSAPPTGDEAPPSATVPAPVPAIAGISDEPAIPGWEVPGPTWSTPAPPYGGLGPMGPTLPDDPEGEAGGEPATTRSRRPPRWAIVAVVAALVGALVGSAVTALAVGGSSSSSGTNTVREVAPGPALTGGASIPAIVTKVAPQVVSVDATGRGASGSFEDQGTGMILSTAGEVLTNNHVISGATAITVTLYGKTVALPATVVGADPAHDVALLKITTPPSGLDPITFGDSTQLQVGDAVIAIGNALGLSAGTPTVTSGIVSALGRTVQAGDVGSGQTENLTNMIQTDAAINSGNSGGALVDSAGQVIGMNTAVASSTANNAPAENIGFAIPSSTLQSLLPSLRSGGSAVTHRAYLGVEVEDLTPQLKQAYNFVPSSGAVVVRTVAGSPAAAAGIQQGDVIVQFGSTTVDSAAALTSAVSAAKPGDKVRITFWRGQQKMTVVATLGSTAGS
jgi:putative serine protease PepD